MRITVGMLKGGASRTTTAVYLALADHARSGKPVLLVDADPANGTAFEWAEDAREAGQWPAGVEVAYWPVASLAKRVKAAGVDSVVAQRRPIQLSLLLTRVRRTKSRVESRAALQEHLGLRVLTTEIPMLERFAAAYGTVPDDLSPYTDVIEELHAIEEES